MDGDSSDSEARFKDFEPYPALLSMYKEITNETKERDRQMKPMTLGHDIVMRNDPSMVDFLKAT